MKTTVTFIILFLASTSASAQKTSYIDIGIYSNYTPAYRLNNDHHGSAKSFELNLSVPIIKNTPLELHLLLATGYHSSVQYSYGIGISYIFFENNDHWLKGGIKSGRIKMKYGSGIPTEPGELMLDERHEFFTPYVGWEWFFSDFVSLYLQAGYRFIRSETNRVKNIVTKNEHVIVAEMGPPIGLYGSGIEFSIGFSIPIYLPGL